MSRKANPTLVGAFVVGAVAIAVAALLLFGAADLWRDKLRAVLYFDGSVRGLNVGSSVVFRGVQVGRVIEVKLYMDPESAEALIQVMIELDSGKANPTREVENPPESEEALDLLLQRGLKGRLEKQSLLTGLLLVELDMLPDEPTRLVGFDSRYREIPTLPTVLQALEKKFEQLDVEALLKDLNETMSGINALVNSPDVEGSLSTLQEMLRTFDGTAQTIDSQVSDLGAMLREIGERVEPSMDRLDTLIEDARAALTAARGAIENVDRRLSDEGGVLTSVGDAAHAGDRAFESAGALLAPDSYAMRDLQSALRELAAAARALRQLAQTLERNPEALLRGK